MIHLFYLDDKIIENKLVTFSKYGRIVQKERKYDLNGKIDTKSIRRNYSKEKK